MLNKEINEKNDYNNHVSNNNDNVNNEWELESEDYFRLKLDSIQKIKQKINGILKLKSLKYRKLDGLQQIFLEKINNYLQEEIYPHLNITDSEILYNDKLTNEGNANNLSNVNNVNSIKENNEDININITSTKSIKDDICPIFTSINIDNSNYNYTIKPEVGNALIFSIDDKNNINYIGKSEKYIEATTKIAKINRNSNDSMLARKTNREIRYKIIQTKRRNNLEKEKAKQEVEDNNIDNTDELNEELSNKKLKIKSELQLKNFNKNIGSGSSNSNKKKRKKIFSYKKNSTVIELKRINKE